MSKLALPVAAITIVLVSGCINSGDSFDLSESRIQDINLEDNYILTCHVPNDASLNHYKITENSKKGYSVRGFYLSNKNGRTDFFIYDLTSGTKSLDYLFGDSKEAYKSAALEDWNKKQLAAKGYDRDYKTFQSSTMTEINGVKTDRVIRTIAKDQKGDQMLAESCWFDYSNAFWFSTSTWPDDYYNKWATSDFMLHHER
jgi:hypothetical protein